MSATISMDIMVHSVSYSCQTESKIINLSQTKSDSLKNSVFIQQLEKVNIMKKSRLQRTIGPLSSNQGAQILLVK